MKPTESWLCLLLVLAVGSSLATETRRNAIDSTAIVKAIDDAGHRADSPLAVSLGQVVSVERGGTTWIILPSPHETVRPQAFCGNAW